MSSIAYVHRIIEGKKTNSLLELQRTDPSRSFSVSDFTLPEDVSAVESVLTNANGRITADGLEVFRVEVFNQADSLELADLVAGSISGDTDRFYPDRPGTARSVWIPLGLGSSGAFVDFTKRESQNSGENMFYKPEQDRVALLSVIRDPGDDFPRDRKGFKSFETVFQTNRFLLQNVEEIRTERAQVIETFGGPQLFLYGSGAEVYQFTGVLLNTESFPWKAEFIRAYETYLKGSKAREKNLRVFLAYDDVLREGYILNAGISYSVGSFRYVVFRFSMFITSKRLFSLHPRSLGLREEMINYIVREVQGTEASEAQEDKQNVLGYPLVFANTLTQELKDILRGKINKAKNNGNEPPYLLAHVTGVPAATSVF